MLERDAVDHPGLCAGEERVVRLTSIGMLVDEIEELLLRIEEFSKREGAMGTAIAALAELTKSASPGAGARRLAFILLAVRELDEEMRRRSRELGAIICELLERSGFVIRLIGKDQPFVGGKSLVRLNKALEAAMARMEEIAADSQENAANLKSILAMLAAASG